MNLICTLNNKKLFTYRLPKSIFLLQDNYGILPLEIIKMGNYAIAKQGKKETGRLL